MKEKKKIGILHREEGPFPDRLINEINNKNIEGITAETCKISEIHLAEPCEYTVIIDRASHYLPFLREYVKNALLSGTYIINNPYRFEPDKLFDYTVAKRIKEINLPRTILLPSKNYRVEPCYRPIGQEDLKNLSYPLNWDKIVSYIGFPAVLKPALGVGWRHLTVVNNFNELMEAYDRSGSHIMILQEKIKFEHFVRTFVLGKKYVCPIKYIPEKREYICEHKHLSRELGKYIADMSIKLCKILDYDMNIVEWAIRDGIPYAIDFTDLVPESHPKGITHFYYEWLVEHMTKIALEYTIHPPKVKCWDTINKLIGKTSDEWKKTKEEIKK